MIFKKQNYDSRLRRQVMTCPSSAREMIEKIRFGMQESHFPKDDALAAVRHLFVTGSGDCHAALIACKPILEDLIGSLFGKIIIDTPLEIARYLPLCAASDDAEGAKRSLLVALSVWGFPARIVEGIERAKKLKMPTVNITNNPDSPVGRAADYLLNIHMHVMDETRVGCRDYIGMMAGTVMLAACIGECNGMQPAGTIDQIGKTVIEIADNYQPQIERLDNEAFAIAALFHDRIDRVECVADGYNIASALFCAAKTIETSGRFATFTDSIHFRRNSVFSAHPEKILTVFYLETEATNRSSIARAIESACATGRPVVVVADAPLQSLGITQNVHVLSVPKGPKKWPALTTFYNHIPMDLLTAYLCEFWGGVYFREEGSAASDGREGFNTIWSAPGVSTLRNSKIVFMGG